MQFQGVHTAIVTPFRDGEVDLDAFRALCRRQQEGGVDGLVVCGTTGETPTLAHAEWRALLQAAREAVGDALPLTMGCGTNDTARTVDLLREARDLGADAALVVTPYYNKPSPAGHRAHVAACVDVGLPVMLYHIPGRTGQRLSVELITELCETEGVVALKEATADLTLAQALMNRTDAAMMSGDDFTFAALMAVGGAGVVSVLSNVAPEQTVTMGCGTNDTARTVDLLREARDLGADAALVVTPYYNKPSPAGHRAHVAACVDVGLPVMLYHIPGRTGQRLSVELITELCETEGVVALKEATADLTLAQALMNRTDAAMMSGDDFTFAALMAVGGAGVVSVLSNVAPEQTVAWARAASAGDREQVVALRRQLTPVVDYLFHSTNPAPCKAILARMGLCENELRLPLVPVDLAPEGLVAGLR